MEDAMEVESERRKTAWQIRLQSLCAARMQLYARYRAGKMSREDYFIKIQPLDAAVDRLEWAIFTKGRLCRKRI